MEMAQFEGVLLLFAIARVDGLGKLWGFNDFAQNERTTKTILEYCYPNDSLTEPIVIFGDFNEAIDRASIVRLNGHAFSLPSNSYGVQLGATTLKASKIVLTVESPEKLEMNLGLLLRTKWWNHMARFFIVAKNKKTCKDFRRMLEITWKMNILNSIYICDKSMTMTRLYTMNPMANSAPHPWKKQNNLTDVNIFRQVFDANVSCGNLHYDKTKILKAHEIKIGLQISEDKVERVGEKVYLPIPNYQTIDYRILELIIRTMNASSRIKRVIGHAQLFKSFKEEKLDINIQTNTLTSYLGLSFFFPHKLSRMIAVVKLSPELSTLQKILHMWSSPVLIAAGVALLVLTLILTVKNRNLSLAMLDIVRLLTYTTIHTNARGHWFRIYFTTMLIFMVISNGVFQGQIAAFLTKEERAGAVETIDELVKLNYSMYTSGTKGFAMARCPKCTFKQVGLEDCINLVLNSTRHVCGIEESHYEARYPLLPLEIVKEILNEEFENFKCRDNWPLQERFNNAIMRLVESGIIDFWKMRASHELTQKRREMEAEWSSAKYKPVRLYKLEFAFQVLAYGLGLATIVFIIEIFWANYVSKMVSEWSSKLRNYLNEP